MSGVSGVEMLASPLFPQSLRDLQNSQSMNHFPRLRIQSKLFFRAPPPFLTPDPWAPLLAPLILLIL